jgi:hypothetical protein
MLRSIPVFPQIALAALAALVLAIGPRRLDAQRPKMPYVRSAPCEGPGSVGYCYPEWASCARITLRMTPSETAPVAAVIDSGRRVRVLTGEMRTTSPGLVVVRRAFTFTERLDGTDGPIKPANPKRWRLRAGDTIYVVDRWGDGDGTANFTWIYRGQEANTGSFWLDLDEQREFPEIAAAREEKMVAEMQQDWWVYVRGPRDVMGWTRALPEWSGKGYYDDSAEKCAR